MNDFRDRLTNSATSFEVTPVESDTVAQRARQRARRATVLRIGAVALLLTGGAVGVRQLSTDTISSEPNDTPPAAANPTNTATDDPSAYPPGPATTSAVVVIPDGDASVDEWDQWYDNEMARFGALPQVSDAQLVATDYEWRVIDAASPEVTALRYDPTYQYAVGTADSDSPEEGWSTVLLKQSNGTWTKVSDTMFTPGTFDSAQVGNLVYRVSAGDGLDPESEPSPTLERLDLNTGETSDVVTPSEMFDVRPAPSDNVVTDATVELSSNGAALMVAVHHIARPQRAALGLSDEWEVDVRTDPGADGEPATIYAYSESCYVTLDTSVSESLPESAYDDCEKRIPLSETSLTDADIDALNNSTADIWIFADEQWSKQETTNTPADSRSLSGGMIVSEQSPSSRPDFPGPTTCRTPGDDGNLLEVFDGAQMTPMIGEPCGRVDDGVALATYADHVLRQEIGNPDWTASNMNSLIGFLGLPSNSILSMLHLPDQFEANPSAADAIRASVRHGNNDGPTVLTSGEYTLTLPADGMSSPTLVNNTTGDSHPFDYWDLSTDTGKIMAYSYDDASDQTVPTTQATESQTTLPFGPVGEVIEFEGDWSTIKYFNSTDTEVILRPQADGSYKVVNLDQVNSQVELADGRSYISHIRTSGDQVILTYSSDDGDGVEQRNLVAIGTPK